NAVSVMHDQGTLLADLALDAVMRPIDGFLRTLFITSRAVARHMGGKRLGVIRTLSEPGSKLAVGGIVGHSVSGAGEEAFPRVRAAGLVPRNIRVVCIRPHAVIDAPASGSYEGPVRTGGSISGSVGPGVARGPGGGDAVEAPADALGRGRDRGVPGLGSG